MFDSRILPRKKFKGFSSWANWMIFMFIFANQNAYEDMVCAGRNPRNDDREKHISNLIFRWMQENEDNGYEITHCGKTYVTPMELEYIRLKELSDVAKFISKATRQRFTIDCKDEKILVVDTYCGENKVEDLEVDFRQAIEYAMACNRVTQKMKE